MVFSLCMKLIHKFEDIISNTIGDLCVNFEVR